MINEIQAKKYCKEDISKIKNYDKAVNDNSQTWECHHMTETWWNCTKKELIENECYYGRKACELIFLTPAEHRSLHMKSRTFTEESRRKISEARKGKPTWIKGKHHSDESRRKISESNKGNIPTEETRIKISKAKKGNTYRRGKTNSIFGKAFQEHYGIIRTDNKKLYEKEYNFYNYHGHFSWEVM